MERVAQESQRALALKSEERDRSQGISANASAAWKLPGNKC